ncbi:MAG: glycerol-3-phosphate acyltransferase [Ardenticatenales bacterium]|nr:glycerol-3-phosphate acyltransferase [Ardenticatenales bacterium]
MVVSGFPLLAASAAAVIGYLLGSIPFGIVIGRLLGVDPRAVGSGRTGTTNVYRAVGWPGALGTLIGDVLKAALAVWIAGRIAPEPAWQAWAMSAAAVAAILGHNHSIYIGFRGGAGGTPNAGALLAIWPAAFVPGIVLAALAWFGVRIASVATLTISLWALGSMVYRVAMTDASPGYLLYGFGQLVLIVWALRPNIARLVRGEERRIELSRDALAGRTPR